MTYSIYVKYSKNDSETKINFDSIESMGKESLYKLATGWIVRFDSEMISDNEDELMYQFG